MTVLQVEGEDARRKRLYKCHDCGFADINVVMVDYDLA
jgi:hypothetical protein